MKTFKDLTFQPHPCAIALKNAYAGQTNVDPYIKEMFGATQATMEFPNGYGISVVCGVQFYSNGHDTYEVCDLYQGSSHYGQVRGWLSADEVTRVMKEIQERQGQTVQ